MGDNLTGLYAAAACMVALCLSGSAGAQAPSPLRDTGARGAIGAPGVVVRFEESTGKGIVYHEEAGGMTSTIPLPVKATKAAVPAPAAAEATPSRTPAAAPGKVAERRALPPDAAVAVKQ